MKKLQIFEPAMCCDTGLCGVGVDPELIRITTVIDTLKKKEIEIERYNLTSAPQVFVTNQTVNSLIKEKGVEILPISVLDDVILTTGRYPSNSEIAEALNIPVDFLGELKSTEQEQEDSEGCCCSGGGCCCE